MIEDDKPPLDEVMKHHGVKGMHWGVRKQHESSGGHGSSGSKPSMPNPSRDLSAENALRKAYMAIPPIKRTPKQAAKALADSEAKSNAKLGPSIDPEAHKHMSPEQQKMLKTAAKATLVVGGLVALNYFGQKQSQKSMAELGLDVSEFSSFKPKTIDTTMFKELAGKPVSLSQYNSAVSVSKMKSWGVSGYIQESSHLREEFTLSAGHTFHRLSTYPEDSFGKSTYATHNIDDFNRYVSIFRHEKWGAELNHITFQTSKDLKVPNLATTLETLREVMGKEPGAGEVSHKIAMEAYQTMSGSSWDHPRAAPFFEALKTKGYGAIVDEMDAGVVGESPIVVFAHEHLTAKVVQPLTKEMIATAESSLVELANRKL